MSQAVCREVNLFGSFLFKKVNLFGSFLFYPLTFLSSGVISVISFQHCNTEWQGKMVAGCDEKAVLSGASRRREKKKKK